MDNGRKTASIFKVTRIKGIPQVLLRQGNYKGIELFHQPDEIIGHYGPKAKCHVRIKTFASSSPFVEVKLSLESVKNNFIVRYRVHSVSAILSTNTILHHKIHAKFKTPTVQMLMFLWIATCKLIFFILKKKSPSLCIRCFNN